MCVTGGLKLTAIHMVSIHEFADLSDHYLQVASSCQCVGDFMWLELWGNSETGMMWPCRVGDETSLLDGNCCAMGVGSEGDHISSSISDIMSPLSKWV